MTGTRTRGARWLVAAMVGAMVATIAPVTAVAQTPAPSDIRVGGNVALRHDDPRPTRGRDAVGLAVDPDDPDHMVMVNADLYTFECEFHTTFDGGVTWDSGLLRAPEGFGAPSGSPEAPCSSVGHGTSSFTGSVVFGSGDNVYVAFASARYAPEGTPEFGLSALVARSTDGGRTFATGVVALPGAPDHAFDNRFPAVAAIPRANLPDRLVVAAWDHGGETPQRDAAVATSEDGGLTWSPRRTANADDQAARELSHPVAGPDGTVYLAWRDYEFEGEIRLGRSTDGGATWESFLVDDVVGYRSPDRDWSCCNHPRIAVDPNDGTVYVAYFEGPLPPIQAGSRDTVRAADHFIHPNADVFLTRSTDRGATWSAPVKVNDDPPEENGNQFHQIRHASVSVAPNGRVNVVWHDRRHWYRGCQHTHAECNEARLGDTYLAFSTDRGATFSDDIRVTDQSMNNDVGSDYRLGVYWDFPPVAAPLGDDELIVAWMDPRQGSFQTDALDIYYAKVSLDAATTPLPVRRLPAAGTADLSVALGRYAYQGGAEATLVSTFATREWSRVVVVNEDDPAAALVGGVLARYSLAPVLATPAGGLPATVADEVARIEPVGAHILGDTTAVSDQVVADLTAAGVPADAVNRVATGAPAELAAEVATILDLRTQGEKDVEIPAFEAVIVVNPDSAEAATAAALASARRLPVLFVGRDSVPPVTRDTIGELHVDTTLVVGGPDVVSDAVLGQLPGAKRLGGADVAATSRAVVAESLARGLPANMVYVADAATPMQAALLGAAVGRATGLLLVVPGADPAAATAALGDLGLTADVDRLVIPGGLDVRALLTWACPDGTVPASGFTDVAGNTHQGAIACAAWYGLTTGGPGGLPASQFGPDIQVPRDQMASFIARLIDHANPGLLPAAGEGNPFPCDLQPSNVHFDAIRRLAAAGIVQGGPGGADADCYGPDLPVRRDQMATFIYAAVSAIADTELVTDRSFFDDVSGVHAGSINALASEGIVLGRAPRQYQPARTVARDAMTSFLDRAMDYFLQHDLAHWPDLVVR